MKIHKLRITLALQLNTQDMKNYHVLKVAYLGPTNFKGSRVKITSERFEQSKTISWNYSFNSSYDIAADWLKNNGFDLLGIAEGKDCYYIISETFKPLKNGK